MRTIEVTYTDGSRGKIVLTEIQRMVHGEPDEDFVCKEATTYINLRTGQYCHIQEPLDSFTARYEAAMDEMEGDAQPIQLPPDIKVINLSDNQSVCTLCASVYLVKAGHTCTA